MATWDCLCNVYQAILQHYIDSMYWCMYRWYLILCRVISVSQRIYDSVLFSTCHLLTKLTTANHNWMLWWRHKLIHTFINFSKSTVYSALHRLASITACISINELLTRARPLMSVRHSSSAVNTSVRTQQTASLHISVYYDSKLLRLSF